MRRRLGRVEGDNRRPRTKTMEKAAKRDRKKKKKNLEVRKRKTKRKPLKNPSAMGCRVQRGLRFAKQKCGEKGKKSEHQLNRPAPPEGSDHANTKNPVAKLRIRKKRLP